MINTGDTAFMMICAALVFIMTPGLAFFYGGLGFQKKRTDHHDAEFYFNGCRNDSLVYHRILADIWSGCTRVGRRIEIHVPSRSRHGSQSGLRKHDPIYVLL